MAQRCIYCGSSKHEDSRCNIKEKADLMIAGVPPEHLFDAIIGGVECPRCFKEFATDANFKAHWNNCPWR